MAKLAQKKVKKVQAKTKVAKRPVKAKKRVARAKAPKKSATAKKSVARASAPKKSAKAKKPVARAKAPKKSAKATKPAARASAPKKSAKVTKPAARAKKPVATAGAPHAGSPQKSKPAPRLAKGRGPGSHRKDGGMAFLPDPADHGGRRVKDDLAEELGEEFVSAATGEATEDTRDAPVTEEDGGPFITTSADSQYAPGTDESNPEDALREPFPLTQGGP